MLYRFHKSFILEPPKTVAKNKSVVLFHGMSASPLEMRGMAQLLQSRGFRVSVPLLSGHGSSVRSLCTTSAEHWLLDVERAVEGELRSGCQGIFFAGLSFGALLALFAAEKWAKNCEGVALLAPPIRFRSKPREYGLQLLKFLPDPLLNLLGTVKKKPGVRSYPERRPRESYPVHSIAAGARLVQIRDRVLNQAQLLQSPLLVLYDPEEDRIALSGIEELKSCVDPVWWNALEIESGGHNLSVGSAAERVEHLVADFACEAAVASSESSNMRE